MTPQARAAADTHEPAPVPLGSTVVRVVVDGAPAVLTVDPATSLVWALRDAGHLAPTIGCEQGECGSCSVLLDGVLVCACLVAAGVCDGATVDTAAGLLGPDLAAELTDRGAVQCGFCTPGFVVAATALLAAAEQAATPPGPDVVREALAGNLCRCTGYEAIVEAVVTVGRRRARR